MRKRNRGHEAEAQADPTNLQGEATSDVEAGRNESATAIKGASTKGCQGRLDGTMSECGNHAEAQATTQAVTCTQLLGLIDGQAYSCMGCGCPLDPPAIVRIRLGTLYFACKKFNKLLNISVVNPLVSELTSLT